MFTSILFLLLGLTLIIFGADILTTGAASLARRFRISELVVGLTVIAVGTSAPELVVSSLSAANGDGDMAIGNVIGSNIFNILIILGITSLITNIRLSKNNVRKDIAFVLISAVIMVLFALSNSLLGFGANGISRLGGVLLLLFYGAFIAYTIRMAMKQRTKETNKATETKEKKVWVTVVMIIGGLVGLVYGGELFLDHAKNLATMAGISNSVIAITIMAGGTSLPELASCIAAARRGKAQMALGNVIGSNITNIFLVLGTSAVIKPLALGTITHVDLAMLVISSLLLFITAFTFKKAHIDKIEGGVFILIYLGYIIYTVSS